VGGAGTCMVFPHVRVCEHLHIHVCMYIHIYIYNTLIRVYVWIRTFIMSLTMCAHRHGAAFKVCIRIFTYKYVYVYMYNHVIHIFMQTDIYRYISNMHMYTYL